MNRTFVVLARSIRAFFRDDGPFLAAAMAFFAFMAIVPVSMFILSLMGYFLGESETFYRFFISKLAFLIPSATNKVAAQIKDLVQFSKVDELSVVSYVFLSFGLFLTMEKALNIIFKVEKHRNFFASLFLALVLITCMAALMLASFAFTVYEPVMGFLGGVLKWEQAAGFYSVVLKYVLPFLLVFLTSVALYLILPLKKVRYRNAAWGGLFTSVMLELAKHAYAYYVRNAVPVIGAVYGPLAAFFFFLMWIYYSSAIFLVGAEIVHTSGTRGEG